MPNHQTSYPQTFVSPNLVYHICSYLSNQYIRFGHYTCKTMVCQVSFMHEYALKSSAIFCERILIFLKNLKKVYKGLENIPKVWEN
jgi:hypothetical protein